MFNLFKKSILGLDLSELSFKIVRLESQGGNISLASFVEEGIPAGLVEAGEIKNEKEVVALLKKALKRIKGGIFHKSQQVVANLPVEKVFIRMVQLPKMKKEELSQAIKWETEANIPLDADEVYLDWQIVKPLSNNLDHLDVLIAAVPKNIVNGYLSLLNQVGLKAIALEPEAIALIRGLIREDELKPTMIVDLGETKTNFVIFSAGTFRFSFRISISGRLFVEAIMKKMNLDKEKAEQLKIEVGLDKDKEEGKVYQALEPIVSDLSQQILDYIAFYHEHATHVHGPDGVIAQILLCGGDSLLNNLPSFLSQKTNLPVALGNPWINFPSVIPAKVISKKEALKFTIALGLALREFQE